MVRTAVSYHSLVGYLALMAWASLLSGCGNSVQEGYHPSEDQKAIVPIGEFNDFKGRPQQFNSVFAPGAAPAAAEQARYKRFEYNPKTPKLSGDTGIVPVTVSESKSGKVVGEVEWNVVKIGEEWKIKDAPLPPEAK
jgi:hypothetical protein